jgi:hypothetical protein
VTSLGGRVSYSLSAVFANVRPAEAFLRTRSREDWSWPMASASESQGERVAENEATFRRANEALYRRFREVGTDELAPFLCECGDHRCTQTIRLKLEEYEEVREQPGRFVVIPGHEILEVEQVVEAGERYEVVEKPSRLS